MRVPIFSGKGVFWEIDRFTIYIQIYGWFIPQDLVTTIPLICNLQIQYNTGIQVACITYCHVGQTSGKLSGCQKQPLLKWHA